jgi:hypothetical protein
MNKSTVLITAMILSGMTACALEENAPLDIKLPVPVFMGTPKDLPINEYVEKLSETPRAPFLAPRGCLNVAANKQVTSSDASPITGELALVTDGDKEANDTTFVELHRKSQWIQIDLGAINKIHALLIWHAHNTAQIYHDVIVQLADDADFTSNVRTVFNNDYDNSTGLGVGKDKEYVEDYQGRLISVNGEAARFVRLYSKGSTYSSLNRYTEVEVYGLAAK